jgi:hypothetical protein
MFSIGMKKIGNTLPCRSAPLYPIQPRATSNSLCLTNRKHNNFVSNQTIQIGNILVPIPCFLLPHTEEFNTLIAQVGYLQAIKLLAAKYNVNIEPSRQNVKRYIYPNVDIGVMPPVIQYNTSFILNELAPVPSYVPDYDKWSVRRNDARYVSVCNDDTTTFSYTFTDMQTLAKYWTSKLPTFTSPYYTVLINSNQNPLNTQSGFLLLSGNRIIFVPIIYNVLFLFYTAYPENQPFNLLSIGSLEKMQSRLFDVYDIANVDCEIKTKYNRVLD